MAVLKVSILICPTWISLWKIGTRIHFGTGSGSTFSKCGSEDPRQNEMDPKRWFTWIRPAYQWKLWCYFTLLYLEIQYLPCIILFLTRLWIENLLLCKHHYCIGTYLIFYYVFQIIKCYCESRRRLYLLLKMASLCVTYFLWLIGKGPLSSHKWLK